MTASLPVAICSLGRYHTESQIRALALVGPDMNVMMTDGG